MTAPLAEMFTGLLRNMSGATDSAIVMSNTQRQRILRMLFEAYYADLSNGKVIFDTSRAWCNFLPQISQLFPAARVICCVRSPAWIIDSVERYIQANSFLPAKLFRYEPWTSVYNRVEVMLAPGGFVTGSLHALRQAWFGEHADRLVAVPYESLTRRPAEVMRRLYDLLGEEAFDHDFEHLEYDEPEFDALVGMPGFHRVALRVQAPQRQTILPPDVFKSQDHCFWNMPDQNPRGVVVL